MQTSRQPNSRPRPPLFVVLTGLTVVLSTAAIVYFGWSYYSVGPEQRVMLPEHRLFKSSGTVGVACGIAATLLFLSNLLYLPRRRYAEAFKAVGSMRSWLSWHVVSGLSGAVIVVAHSAVEVKSPLGAALVWSLVIVAVTGGIGRYLVHLIPRTKAGELLPAHEVDAAVMAAIDELRPFVVGDVEGIAVLNRMADTVDASKGALPQTLGVTILRLRQVRADLAILQRTLRETGAKAGAERIRPLLARVKATYRQAAAYGFVSLVLDSWRTFHRVLALFFVVALLFHIFAAIYYGFVRI